MMTWLLLLTALIPAQSTQVFVTGAPDLVDPVLLRQVEPSYTTDGLIKRIQGKVELEAVVLANGTVGDVRVKKSLDATSGLDDAAIAAGKRWLFKPATRRGVAVDAVVILEMSFRLPGLPEPVDGDPNDPFARGLHSLDEPGLVPPKSIYTPGWPQPSRAVVQGAVAIDIGILPDGTIGRARGSLIPGTPPVTGEQLMAALKDWRFEPATLDGKPVAVLGRVRIVLPK